MDDQTKRNRTAQFGLRTVVEAVFVTAVILAMLYQGFGRQPKSSRFQVVVNMSDNYQSGVTQSILTTVIDSETGQCYQHNSTYPSPFWQKFPTLP